MKKILAVTKNNYQIIISVATILAIAACFAYGQINKANAQAVKSVIEKTR